MKISKSVYKWSRVKNLDGLIYYDIVKKNWLGYRCCKKFIVGYEWNIDKKQLTDNEIEAKEKLQEYVDSLRAKGHQVSKQ